MKKVWIIISIILGILLLGVLGVFIYINTAFLSKNEIKEIIIKDTGKTSDEIHFENVDLEMGENVYEVDLYYNNTEYEYKINAKNGRIIYNNFKPTQNNSAKDAKTSENTNTNEKTLNEAKTIATKHACLEESSINFTKTEKETDDGIQMYDIEFTFDNYKYDYEITVNGGEIIKYGKEKINKIQ